MKRSLVFGIVLASLFWVSPASAAECPGAGYGTIVLTFEIGSTKVSAEGRERLKEFSGIAKHKDIVCVVGQADKQGDAAVNERLAKQRAESVKQVLLEYGVPERAIEVHSRGEAFGGSGFFGLFKDNETDRRVEVSYNR